MILTNGDGSVVGELPRTAEDVLAQAEEHARDHYLAKRSYFPIAVREEIEAAGFQVSDSELATAMEKLDAVRSGARAESIRIRVALDNGGNRRTVPHAKGNAMSSKPLTAHRFFEAERMYPDAHARAWYDRLVGLDEHKRQLLLELELLLYPDRLVQWSRKHHCGKMRACQIMAGRAP